MPQAAPTSAAVSSQDFSILTELRVVHQSHPATGCVSPGKLLRHRVQRSQDTAAEVISEVSATTTLNPKDSWYMPSVKTSGSAKSVLRSEALGFAVFQIYGIEFPNFQVHIRGKKKPQLQLLFFFLLWNSQTLKP